MTRGVEPRFGKRGVKAVRLTVDLVDQVEADKVADLVPIVPIRVVGAADGVEIVLLGQPSVPQHRRPAHHLAPRRAVLVPVHS